MVYIQEIVIKYIRKNDSIWKTNWNKDFITDNQGIFPNKL